MTLLFLLSQNSLSVSALSGAQKQVLDSGIYYFDTDIGNTGACSGATNLTGSENAEKVWNYLIGKGLTPPQVAGILGNMKHEAHFEPRLVEYGYPNSRGEISVQGTPSSLDDEVPPNSNSLGQPGYGIVQWTSPGRKQGLRDLSASRGIQASDLGLQLDYLWQELSTSYKSSVLDPIRASTTYIESTNIFLERFEVPGNIEATRIGRQTSAHEFLTLYGSGTPQTPTSTTPTTTNSCGQTLGSPVLAANDIIKKPSFTGSTMTVTGVVLHWTVSPPDTTVDAFVNIIKSNSTCGAQGCSVQFYVDGAGKIYQLVDPINTFTQHAGHGFNSCCIGIEIAGMGASDLLSNNTQKQAVISLVRFLTNQFNIPIENNLANKRGIFSHHQIASDKQDVGNEYFNQVFNTLSGGASP